MHKKVHEIANAIIRDVPRAAMYAVRQQEAVIKQRIVMILDRRCDQNYRHTCVVSSCRPMHLGVHLADIAMADHRSAPAIAGHTDK